MKKKNLAFTLAEVLIVIGIIGVVAALTLPNLNHATGDKEKVTKVKKIYSALTEAVDRAQAIYGPFDTWFNDLKNSDGYIDDLTTANERFAKRVTEFMKISKDCGVDEGCWAESDLLLSDGESIGERGALGYSVILSDKTALTFISGIYSGMQDNFYYRCKCRVDIDGPNKGKYQVGNDIFDFTIDSQTNILIPDDCPDYWTGDLSESYPGDYSTAWVIENSNLDYLKCPDELNWETKTSCE